MNEKVMGTLPSFTYVPSSPVLNSSLLLTISQSFWDLLHFIAFCDNSLMVYRKVNLSVQTLLSFKKLAYKVGPQLASGNVDLGEFPPFPEHIEQLTVPQLLVQTM